MIMKYVDAHCHIQFDQYAQDETEIIGQMRASGIAGIVVGVDYESSKKLLRSQRNTSISMHRSACTRIA